jgi:hypothetical protein
MFACEYCKRLEYNTSHNATVNFLLLHLLYSIYTRSVLAYKYFSI